MKEGSVGSAITWGAWKTTRPARGSELWIQKPRRKPSRSDLCMFCLRHSAGSECYGRGSDSKPACQAPECEEKHVEKLHEMLAGLDANVNLVAEEDEKKGRRLCQHGQG
jgi:hypothetical protein